MSRRRARTHRRRRAAIRAGFAAVILAAAAAVAFGSLRRTPERAGVGAAAIRFTYLDGRSGSFTDFAGKPLVVNFFASWCPTCWKEMDDLERGGVVVRYQALPRKDAGALTRLVQEDQRKVVVAPGPTLQAKLAVSAWGRLMTCRSADLDAVRRFILSYRDEGPENDE